MHLLDRAPRYLFFTGKGGVGKTSSASATAIALADRGRRVLLVSTDPASNLGEVLDTPLRERATPVAAVPGLSALDIDPQAAARAYRERLVGPYRGKLPDAAVRSIEEQLSGACTVEIAAFDEFAKLLGTPDIAGAFDHIVFDTAPTGHTLRLLALPAAWSGFLESSAGGASCLGPLAGLQAQQALYASAQRMLVDPALTALVLVSRPERSALDEAARTSRELTALGVQRQELVLNGLFVATDHTDDIAVAHAERCRRALADMPAVLASLPVTEVPLLPMNLVGIDALRAMFAPVPRTPAPPAAPETGLSGRLVGQADLDSLIDDIAGAGRGVIMTMGKGGVGKTSIAAAVAAELAGRGHRVHLTTTDPAAHVQDALTASAPGLRVSRIDPAEETRAYTSEVLATAGASLDEAGRALLEEDLRSPCTEEIAVFRAFARTVEEGTEGFVVIDTAPTGHTLLLLDAAEAYHREVQRTAGQAPASVSALLPRLRDPDFTRILLVTLPEATPVHEAAELQRDLERADIHPFAWVVNQSLSPLALRDPVLARRQAGEARFIHEAHALAARLALVPWMHDPGNATAA